MKNSQEPTIRLHELTLTPDEDTELLRTKSAKKLGISTDDICGVHIIRESLDARKSPLFKYTADISLSKHAYDFAIKKGFSPPDTPPIPEPIFGDAPVKDKILVVGTGPAGLFAALELLKNGYKPLVVERGSDIDRRVSSVHRLATEGILDPQNNVCFGMGGAGTFSDGKLTSRSKDANVNRVLETFVAFGADERILYEALPHVGTDIMRKVVSNMGEEIKRLGGEIRFDTTLVDIDILDGQLTQVHLKHADLTHTLRTNACILAVGHSARDTAAMLEQRGVKITPKAFAMGVRVEHPRELVDKNQFSKWAGHPRLGSATYKLRSSWEKRGVYSFCMCPGGEVVCSASEQGATAVNGCSFAARDMEFSNSAIVVSVRPEDFAGTTGVEFQRFYEKIAYAQADGYGAIVQRISDFKNGVPSKGDIKTSYAPYTLSGDILPCLPKFITHALKKGFSDFDGQLRGFSEYGNIVGIETRTSSPHRIERDSVLGLYPSGEGAGYSGGIVSSAVDGIKCARALMSRHKRG